MGSPGGLRYGEGGPTESDLRLIGEVGGKRVLSLGCEDANAAAELARAGAHVIATDHRSEVLAQSRKTSERKEIKVEWHQAEPADLAFLRAESIDLVCSVDALGSVEDLSRVFRQVHRVLGPGGHLVFSHDHPVALCTGEGPSRAQSYFQWTPVDDEGSAGEPRYVHPVGKVFTDLARAGFRVDAIVEPQPSRGPFPQTIVWRAKKEGS